MGIKKGKSNPQATHIKKTEIPQKEIKFSFKLFDSADGEMCPAIFKDGYTQTLMQRLKDLSSWHVTRFISGPSDKSIRNHTHDWSKTSRPNGFSHLNNVYKDYPGWQFQLTANEHGRVHGIISDDTFYIIWLDCDHKLYP